MEDEILEKENELNNLEVDYLATNNSDTLENIRMVKNEIFELEHI